MITFYTRTRKETFCVSLLIVLLSLSPPTIGRSVDRSTALDKSGVMRFMMLKKRKKSGYYMFDETTEAEKLGAPMKPLLLATFFL